MKSSNKPVASRPLEWLPRLVAACCLAAVSGITSAADTAPPCYGPENHATQIALVELVNAGHVADASALYHDDNTPYHLKTTLLDAQPIGAQSGMGLSAVAVYRQIQKIELSTRSGTPYTLLTISETSFAECSLSSPTVVILSPTYALLRLGTSALTPR